MYTESIRTVSGPPCLSVPDLNRVDRSREFLDVTNGLHKIIKVGGSRVADVLALPVCKGIHKSGDYQPSGSSLRMKACWLSLQNFNTAGDQCVSSSILVFVPAVCGADLDTGDCLLNAVDVL